MQPLTFRNHCKAEAKRKDVLIFIESGTFYNTYDSDAFIMAYFFGYKLNYSANTSSRSVGFPGSGSKNTLKLLADNGFSYVVYKLEDGVPDLITSNKGHQSLNIQVPLEKYVFMIEDLKGLVQKNVDAVRLVPQLEVPTPPDLPSNVTESVQAPELPF